MLLYNLNCNFCTLFLFLKLLFGQPLRIGTQALSKCCLLNGDEEEDGRYEYKGGCEGDLR